MANPIHFRAMVERVERHDPDTATFHLACLGRYPRFKPGQFVHLTLDEYDPSRHWPESRAFSIASGPSALPSLRLTISRQGCYTSRTLEEVRLGRILWLKGPYGEFVVAPKAPSDIIVLVAGGTGITPFCAYMEGVLSGNGTPSNPMFLYYGARTPELLMYRDLADRCVAFVPGVQVRYFVEQPGTTSDMLASRLDIDRIAAEQAQVRDCLFYLSGPKAMIVSFSDRLRISHSVPLERILIDAWD